MIGLIKTIAPYGLYLIGAVILFLSMTGRIQWGLAFIIALLPLTNVTNRLQSLPLGKDFIDILLVIMILGWVIGAAAREEKLIQNTFLNWVMVVMIMYTFISLLVGSAYLDNPRLFSLSDVRTQDWKNYCTLPLLFFLTFNNIKDKKWIWRIVLVMCGTMVLMDYYLFNQLTFFSSLVSRQKVKGTFVHLGPNEVAAFYNQYTVILISIMFAMKEKIPKLLLAGLIVINVYCILFLFSRAAYLGFFIGCSILFLINKKVLLIPLVIIAIAWQTLLPQKVIDRIQMTKDEYGEFDLSIEQRLTVWQQSIELFKENPLIGAGFGVFHFAGFALGDTHNSYLKVLAEQGVVGLFIFLLLIACFFLQGVRLYSSGDDDLSRALGLGFMVCMIVLFINNIFGDRWLYLQLSSNLWVFAALVTRLNVLAKDAQVDAISQNRRGQ